MTERRKFLKLTFAALPASMAFAPAGPAKGLLGAWSTLHTSPAGPFREFLVFAEGGGLTETNTLLHANSNLGLFAALGLPLPPVVNASDGFGNWDRAGRDEYEVAFRKLLFDGSGTYFGEFHAAGRVQLRGGQLLANWHRLTIESTSGEVFELGSATSEGTRID